MEPQQFPIPMDPFFPASSIHPIFLSSTTTTTQQPPNPQPTYPTPTPTPTHTMQPTPAQHPPYQDMITKALVELNEREGSSKQAISKYIDRVFKNLPSNHSELLTHHIKMLKNSGQIVLFKRSYMLPQRSAPAPTPFSAPPPNAAANGAADASTVTYSTSGASGVQNFGTFQCDYQSYYDGSVVLDQNVVQAATPVDQSSGHALNGVPNNVVSTGQGNGGVSGSEAMFVSLGLSDGASVDVHQTKKRRGRPPKYTSAFAGQGVPEPVAQSGPNEPSVAPPPPGISPVHVPVEAPASTPASGTGRPRGRPKKVVVEAAAAVAVPAPNNGHQQPKKRGRKPKNAAQVIHSAVPVSMVMPNPGIPSDTAVGPPQYTVGPPQYAVGDPNGLGSLPPVGAPQLVPGKRRGRPPGGGRLKKQRKLNGNWKPLGRPRKNPPSDNSRSLIVQNLRSKLEYLQSRIRENVSIIKPSVNMETSTDAMGALQHLEELTSAGF